MKRGSTLTFERLDAHPCAYIVSHANRIVGSVGRVGDGSAHWWAADPDAKPTTTTATTRGEAADTLIPRPPKETPMTTTYDLPEPIKPRAIVDHDLRALSIDDLADIHEALVDLSSERFLVKFRRTADRREALDACHTVDLLVDRIDEIIKRREADHG